MNEKRNLPILNRTKGPSQNVLGRAFYSGNLWHYSTTDILLSYRKSRPIEINKLPFLSKPEYNITQLHITSRDIRFADIGKGICYEQLSSCS